MRMAADFLQKHPAGGPGRPFEKGRSGNPAGRRPGSRNKATLVAERLFDGEAEALSRKAVELALGGSEAALRLCLDRIIAPRRERPVQLTVPPIESLPTGQARGLKAHDIAGAMEAILAAATPGIVTPDEAATIAAELAIPDLDLIKQGEQRCRTGARRWPGAGRVNPTNPARLVVDTFVRTIEASDFRTAFAAGRGRPRQPRGRPSRHEWRRPELVLQPMGEILLQIFCRWRRAQQSTQFLDVGSPGRSVRWDST
jgi:hypothetical protein